MENSDHPANHHRYINPMRRWGALIIGFLTVLLQFHFARVSGSASVWADLGHQCFDSLGTVATIWVYYQTRNLDHDAGHRLEHIWAKRLLALLILAIAWVLHEGIERINEVHLVNARMMQIGASIGLCGNIVQFLVFGGCPCASDHVGRLHIALDILSSVLALVGSFVYRATGSVGVDTMGSFAIAMVMSTLVILTWLDLHKQKPRNS